MRNLVLCVGVLLTALSGAWAGPQVPVEVQGFLDSREVLATVYFAYGSSRLDAPAAAEIDKVRELLLAKVKQGYIVRVEGFSSSEGKAVSNMRLSLHRAEAVASALQRSGMKVDAVMTGYGQLRAGSQPAEQDRRAEVAVYRSTVDLAPVRMSLKD